jgi:hypothetical protein
LLAKICKNRGKFFAKQKLTFPHDYNKNEKFVSSVADPDPNPDPPDPHVLGLPDPDLNPLVKGMDPDPSITMQK